MTRKVQKMGKINKYAHFILAFLGMAIGTPVMLYFFQNPFSLISLTLLITTLAFWNEWVEFVDKDMVYEYTNLKNGEKIEVEHYLEAYINFVADTKRDVKQDLVGIFIGGWIGVAIYGVMQYV